jgi:hypothetical protein
MRREGAGEWGGRAVFFSATILSSSVNRRQRSIVATPADNPNFQSSRLTLFFVAIFWLNRFTLLRAPLPFGEIWFPGDAVGARQDRAFVYNVCLV